MVLLFDEVGYIFVDWSFFLSNTRGSFGSFVDKLWYESGKMTSNLRTYRMPTTLVENVKL